MEYWNSTHTKKVAPGEKVWTDQYGKPASFLDPQVQADWDAYLGKDFYGREFPEIEITYNKEDKSTTGNVVEQPSADYDNYLQSVTNTPIASNQQMEDMWNKRAYESIDKEVQRAEVERYLKGFGNQVDNLFSGRWLLPDQLVGAVERAVNPEYFTGESSNDRYGDFMQNWLLGNPGILTDKYSEEHPNIAFWTNFVFDAVTGKFVPKAARAINNKYEKLMGINNAAAWTPNSLESYTNNLMRPTNLYGRIATNPMAREFVGSMLAGKAFDTGAQALGYESFGDAAEKTFGGNRTAWEFANPGYTMYNGEAAKGLFYDLPKGLIESAYNGLKNASEHVTDKLSNIYADRMINKALRNWEPKYLEPIPESEYQSWPLPKLADENAYRKFVYEDMLRNAELPDRLYIPEHNKIEIIKGAPESVKQDIIHNTVGRRQLAYAKEAEEGMMRSGDGGIVLGGYDEMTGQPSIEQAMQNIDNIKIGYYPDEVFETVGKDADVLGIHYKGQPGESGTLAIRRNNNPKYIGEGGEEGVVRHELEHEMDDVLRLTGEQEETLNAAYDDDFINLPNTVAEDDVLYGYNNMIAERTTTNGDARAHLLGELFPGKSTTEISIADQNAAIDKATDE